MITVVKIGGNVVDNAEALQRFVDNFARLEGPKVLIHGGGKEATRLSKRLDIPTTMIEGRRVTDRSTLDVVTMVYAGLVNKRIVSMLQAAGVNAIGLSGADGNVIRATRRPARPIDYGYVGDIDPENVDSTLIAMLLASGVVPVFCAITHDGNATLLNCNADSVASAVAIACSRLDKVRLVYCFEKAGVLRDVDDEDSLIEHINAYSYIDLRGDGTVSAGMIPKIDNAFTAIDSGVEEVVIAHADNLLTGRGTLITLK